MFLSCFFSAIGQIDDVISSGLNEVAFSRLSWIFIMFLLFIKLKTIGAGGGPQQDDFLKGHTHLYVCHYRWNLGNKHRLRGTARRSRSINCFGQLGHWSCQTPCCPPPTGLAAINKRFQMVHASEPPLVLWQRTLWQQEVVSFSAALFRKVKTDALLPLD